MSAPNVFGVYTAQFPFLDTKIAKLRPVIVVSKPQGRHNIVVVVPVSSKSELEQVDVRLADWSGEGLLKPSVARVHRLTTMLQADLVAELGELSQRDRRQLRRSLRLLLEL